MSTLIIPEGCTCRWEFECFFGEERYIVTTDLACPLHGPPKPESEPEPDEIDPICFGYFEEQ